MTITISVLVLVGIILACLPLAYRWLWRRIINGAVTRTPAEASEAYQQYLKTFPLDDPRD